jgi:hypothetical protein
MAGTPQTRGTHLAGVARRLVGKLAWKKIVSDLEPKLLALVRKSQG